MLKLHQLRTTARWQNEGKSSKDRNSKKRERALTYYFKDWHTYLSDNPHNWSRTSRKWAERPGLDTQTFSRQADAPICSHESQQCSFTLTKTQFSLTQRSLSFLTRLSFCDQNPSQTWTWKIFNLCNNLLSGNFVWTERFLFHFVWFFSTKQWRVGKVDPPSQIDPCRFFLQKHTETKNQRT